MMYATLDQLISLILKRFKNFEILQTWLPSSYSAELLEQMSHIKQSIKLEKKTEDLDWVLWEFTHGSSKEESHTK